MSASSPIWSARSRASLSVGVGRTGASGVALQREKGGPGGAALPRGAVVSRCLPAGARDAVGVRAQAVATGSHWGAAVERAVLRVILDVEARSRLRPGRRVPHGGGRDV